ncbi:MAG: HD domain-containing protein [Acidimicrobiales bacterium]
MATATGWPSAPCSPTSSTSRKAERDQLAWAAVLHDVGKLAVPAAILNKASPLDARERACVELHTVVGHELTEPIAEWLGPYRLVPLEDHERIDGAGYPHGKAGDAISFGARLVAVADVLDDDHRPPSTSGPARGTRLGPSWWRRLAGSSTRRWSPPRCAA